MGNGGKLFFKINFSLCPVAAPAGRETEIEADEEGYNWFFVFGISSRKLFPFLFPNCCNKKCIIFTPLYPSISGCIPGNGPPSTWTKSSPSRTHLPERNSPPKRSQSTPNICSKFTRLELHTRFHTLPRSFSRNNKMMKVSWTCWSKGAPKLLISMWRNAVIRYWSWVSFGTFWGWWLSYVGGTDCSGCRRRWSRWRSWAFSKYG